MKLKVFTEEGLELLEHNIDTNIELYQKMSNDWIYNFMDEKRYIRYFDSEIPNLTLEIDKKNPAVADINNVKVIYSNLKFLTNEQASDDRLWTGVTHLNFWEFMYNRWEVNKKRQTVKNVKSRYFIDMTTSHRRSLIVNTISKYWWVGRILYDENAKDPFYLLKYFESDYSTKTFNLLSSSYSNNDQIIRKTVETLIELENEINRSVTRVEFKEIAAYLNILGGISVLDHLDKRDLSNKIKKRFHNKIKR